MGIFRFPRWLFKCLHREEPSRPGRALLGRSWSPLSQLGARPCAEGASSTSMCGERKENLEEENKNTKNDKQGPYKDNSSKHYTTTEARASASAGRASPVSVIPVGEACCLDPASIASAVAGSVQREINLDLKAISGEEGVGRQPSGQRSALFLASPQATKAALDPASVSDIQVGQASNRQHSPPGTSSPSLNPTPIAVAQGYSFFAPPPPPSSSQLQSQPQAPAPTTMAESEARSLISQLDNAVKTIKAIRAKNPDSSISDETRKQTGTLLSRAKHALLQLDALIPTPSVPTTSLALARETLELSALLCILMQEPKAFTRCVTQLQPFYELPASRLPPGESRRSQVMGLYLLLFLSQGDYAGFHTLLEGLEVAARGAAVMEVEAGKDDGGDANMRGTGDEREARVKDNPLEDDEFIQYPIRLEQALMEGSYDRVWGETKDERVPSEEYKVFSKVGDACKAIIRIEASKRGFYSSGGFRLFFSLFLIIETLIYVLTHRSSSARYAPKSPPAPSAPTPPSPSPMPRTSSSSTARAPSSSLPTSVAGSSATEGYTSHRTRLVMTGRISRRSVAPAAVM